MLKKLNKKVIMKLVYLKSYMNIVNEGSLV